MRRAVPADVDGGIDFDKIMHALRALLAMSPAPQMKYADPATATSYIEQAIADGRIWLMGGFAIMVEVGSDWYSKEKYLFEQIVLRITDDDSVALSTVIRNGLGYLADHYGCRAVFVGDTQVDYMSKHYLNAGFTQIGRQFMKENPRWVP